MQTYGYYSEGESFSIMDQSGVWIMEIIGKGAYEKGSVWVACKIPDSAVSAHANQARITKFVNSKDCPYYASDTISFAKANGFYPADGSEDDFSFSDVYDPVTFEGARFCEARVWYFFQEIMGQSFGEQYWNYAAGYNLTNRMPLWVYPENKISVTDVMQTMRSHYEGTYFDMTSSKDIGSEDANMPVRVSPLTWTNSDGVEYFNERPIATSQTGWNFVAQSRAWMPDYLAAVTWFGVDDSGTTVRFPIHGGARRVPEKFAGKGTQDGVTSPLLTFNWNSAFSVFNLVANYAYTRWSVIYPDVYSEITKLETNYKQQLTQVDENALSKQESEGRDSAIEYVTDWACQTGDDLVSHWGNFFGSLFMKHRDNYNITPDASDTVCACDTVAQPYEQQWYDKIASQTGEHYKVPQDGVQVHAHHNHELMQRQRHSKKKLLARK